MPPSGNGWEEWRKHILSELQRHNECVDKIEAKIDKLEDKMIILSLDVTTNKLKIAFIGSAGGFIGGIIASIITAIVLASISP